MAVFDKIMKLDFGFNKEKMKCLHNFINVMEPDINTNKELPNNQYQKANDVYLPEKPEFNFNQFIKKFADEKHLQKQKCCECEKKCRFITVG